MSGVANFTHVPSFDGQAPLFPKNEEASLWNPIPTPGPRRRAANSLLHMSDIARKVRMAARKDHIGNNGGAQQILKNSRKRFRANDSIYQDAVKFTNFKRIDQTMETYFMEFDMLREKAESRMVMRSGFPDEFASFL